MKRGILLAIFAFIFVLPLVIVNAEEVKEEAGIKGTVPDLRTEQSEVVESGLSPDSEKKGEKEHRHDEGMHGMMGHHSTGWAIMIGVVMVVMMVAMVL